MVEQVIIDTTYLVKTDTITNTEIYFHQTVKLIDSSTNLFVIYVPIFIAILALVFSIWQFILQRRERKVKIKPVLTTHSEIYKNKEIILSLRNEGLGAAKIKKIDYSLGEVRCPNLPDLIVKKKGKDFLDDLVKDGSNQFVFDSDLYISAQDKVELAMIKLKYNKMAKEFIREYKQIKICVEYYNIFNDKMPNLEEYLGVIF